MTWTTEKATAPGWYFVRSKVSRGYWKKYVSEINFNPNTQSLWITCGTVEPLDDWCVKWLPEFAGPIPEPEE